MAICDVCNSQVNNGEGERITAEIFRSLLNNGFGIDESNIEMLVGGGMSREQAVNALKQQYASFTSDWLLCKKCAIQAMKTIARKNVWTDDIHISVTKDAEEVGAGFDIIGAPVALTKNVWLKCVEWTDIDSQQQCYQEQDARLWDVLFTGGNMLALEANQFLQNGLFKYSILCILRDGTSLDSVKVPLVISSKHIAGNDWLIIDIAE